VFSPNRRRQRRSTSAAIEWLRTPVALRPYLRPRAQAKNQEPSFKDPERPAAVGHQLSLADADWPTASGGEEPVAAVGECELSTPLLSVTTVCYREIQSKRCQRWGPVAQSRAKISLPLQIGPPKGASINRYPSPSSGRTVNLNHVLGYKTSGSSTLFFRFGRTHITPG
jgi:hypothetical protein